MPPPALPDGYYLDNFRSLLDHVRARYEDLFSDAEIQFYHQFESLIPDAQRLLVRLLSRKGQLFRVDKLAYSDIQDQSSAIQALQGAGFIACNAEPRPVGEWLGLYNKQEWLAYLALQGIDEPQVNALRRGKRPQLDQFLYSHCLEPLAPPTALIDVLQDDVFQVLKLLYFGNPAQDLTEFVVRDLDLIRYEAYSLSKLTRRFQSREQINRHLSLHRFQQQLELWDLHAETPLTDALTQIPPPSPDDRRYSQRRQSIVARLARQLERIEAFESAVYWFQQCHGPPARERLARMYGKTGRPDSALDICTEILRHPHTEDEREFAVGFAPRLAKQHGLRWPHPKPAVYHPPERVLTLTASSQRVEHAVAGLIDPSGQCHYVENTLFNGVFGLMYWELLFAPVAGAFSHPFQYRPHDLYETDFLLPRQEYRQQCEAAMSENEDGFWDAGRILKIFRDKYGIANRYVVWPVLDEALLENALKHIPAAHWRGIFDRLFSDMKHHASGFPDLIQFHNDGSYCLLEVKAPGDRLQTHQRRWMQYFHQQGIPHEVIRVEWE